MYNLTIAIVATPHHQENLVEAINSIRINWPTEPIHIFGEPGEYTIKTDENTTWHINEVQLGCFCNHANAMEWLANPENNNSEYVLLTQDDFVFAPDAGNEVTRFLDNVKTPFGFLGLYTSPKKKQSLYKRNWQDINFGYASYGVCYFLKTEVLREVISNPFFINHFITYEKNQQVDSTIGYIIHRMNLSTFYHNPSIAKHIGDSTIGHYDPERDRYTSIDTTPIIGVVLDDDTGIPDAKQITKSSLFTQVDSFEEHDSKNTIQGNAYVFNVKPGIIYPTNYIQTSIQYMDQLKSPITRGAEYDANIKAYNFDRCAYLPEPLYRSALSFNVDYATFGLNKQYSGDVVCVPHNANQFKKL